MSLISFDINGIKATGYTSSVKSSSGESFRVVGICPVCKKEIKAGYGMGNLYKEKEVISTYKSNMKKHINTKHKK